MNEGLFQEQQARREGERGRERERERERDDGLLLLAALQKFEEQKKSCVYARIHPACRI